MVVELEVQHLKIYTARHNGRASFEELQFMFSTLFSVRLTSGIFSVVGLPWLKSRRGASGGADQGGTARRKPAGFCEMANFAHDAAVGRSWAPH